MSNIVTASFKDRLSAETALMELERVGITESQVSLVVTDETRGNHFQIENKTKADEGLAAGATFGGIVGGVLAALTAAGVVVIPGLNLVVSGALIAGLAGLGAGAATGGLVGALIGAGIPEHEAKLYEKEIREGGVLMAVEAVDSDQKRTVKDVLKGQDAYHIAA